jgi:hypothetical protein
MSSNSIIVAPDRPAGPEPAPGPTAPSGPDPDPETGPVEPIAYRSDLAPVPEASPAAIAALALARGPAALAELVGQVAALDAELAGQRGRLGGPETRSAVAVIADLAARRGVYAARAAAVAPALGLDPPAIADVPAVPPLALLWARMDARSNLAAEASGRVASARSGLGRAEAELASALALAGDPAAYRSVRRPDAIRRTSLGHDRVAVPGWAPDEVLSRIDPALAARDAAAGELAAALADGDALAALVAGRMSEAVEAAGGGDRVVAAIVAAQALASPAPGPHPELAALDERLARLEHFGADEPLGELRERRRAILDGIAFDRTARRERRRGAADRLVKSALAGDESSRAAIEQWLTQCPDVAPGLARDVALARPERALAAGLAAAV